MKRLSASLALAATLSGFSAQAPGYSFTRQRLFSGFDGKMCKVLPEMATDGRGTVLLSWHKLLLTGCDVFFGLYMSKSTDGGVTWSEPKEQTALADTFENGFRVVRSACVRYGRVKNRWFALGHSSLYKDDKRPYQKRVNGRPYMAPLYVSVDVERGSFVGCKPLPFPFAFASAMPFGQVVECENGDVIVPFYFHVADADEHHMAVGRCVTVRYAFDADGLKVVCAGRPLEMPSLRRGLGEPSLVRFRNRYYLTLRSDERGYFAESDDGLSFDSPRPWTWEDGHEIGNRNTQQHWLVGGDSLYLAYTRERPDNGHVFRHRAPILMAEFDPDARCLLRETEIPLVPELGARLGNFCCCVADLDESWLVTAEWMQSWGEKLGVCEKYGSDNSLWLVKVKFEGGAAPLRGSDCRQR